MKLITPLGRYAIFIRDFIAPRYRPERYYMRGPGPASLRRHHAVRELSLAD